MMKIGLLSDTHIPKRAKHLPRAVVEAFAGVDLILHAGDWQTLDVYEALQEIAPVEGVAGNVDGDELVQKFGKVKRFVWHGVRVGLVHGDGEGKTTEKRALAAFADDPVDLIVFGHSHIPLVRTVGDTTLFNPGSPTDKRRQPAFSCGLLTIQPNGEWHVEHLYFED